MKKIMAISRILSECRTIFNEEDIEVTLNEALTLEAVGNSNGTKMDVCRILFKDKAQVYRTLKGLADMELVEYKEGRIGLTRKGKEVCERSSEICSEAVASGLGFIENLKAEVKVNLEQDSLSGSKEGVSLR